MNSVLETAERVDPVLILPRQQSPAEGGPIYTRRTTNRTPESNRLSWLVASPWIFIAFKNHFARYGRGGVFDFTHCDGRELRCEYVPDSVRWAQVTGSRYQIEATIRTVQ